MSTKPNTDLREAMFRDVVERYTPLIAKVCYMYARSLDDFNDLQQEVLANLWTSSDGFANRSKLSTWIYRVCINTCITCSARMRRHSEHESLSEQMSLIDESPERLEQLREMYRLIERLDPLEKALIMLWLDGTAYDEIGQIMGITKANVGIRIHRVKDKLTKMANE